MEKAMLSQNHNSFRGNIYKIFMIRALKSFMLIMPIIVLFFHDRGLDMREIFILQAVFSVIVVIFEVPSGSFADIYGRKTSIMLGTFLGFCGFTLYAFAGGFWDLLIAESVLGFGLSFVSGSDSALLYDSLAKSNEESHYKKYEGRALSIGNFSEGIAALIGGALATVSLQLPLYAQVVGYGCAFLVACTLREVYMEGKSSVRKNIFVQMRDASNMLRSRSDILALIAYASAVSASTLTMVWFTQEYFILVSVPLALFGIIWAVLQFSAGISSLYAHRIEEIVGVKRLLISLVFIVFFVYTMLGVSASIYAIPLLVLMSFVRGINMPLLRHYVNIRIESNVRATVLSIKNLFGRVVFIIASPLLGWISDVYTLPVALSLSGVLFLSIGLGAILFLTKKRVV